MLTNSFLFCLTLFGKILHNKSYIVIATFLIYKTALKNIQCNVSFQRNHNQLIFLYTSVFPNVGRMPHRKAISLLMGAIWLLRGAIWF